MPPNSPSLNGRNHYQITVYIDHEIDGVKTCPIVLGHKSNGTVRNKKNDAEEVEVDIATTEDINTTDGLKDDSTTAEEKAILPNEDA